MLADEYVPKPFRGCSFLANSILHIFLHLVQIRVLSREHMLKLFAYNIGIKRVARFCVLMILLLFIWTLLQLVSNYMSYGRFGSLHGIWNCSAEPGVTRVFYKNGSYLEFGRATPYARQKKWQNDYIVSGRYQYEKNSLSIRAFMSYFQIREFPGSSNLLPNRLIKNEGLVSSQIKIIDINNNSMFLKTEKNSLFCKRLNTQSHDKSFMKFISYQQNKYKFKVRLSKNTITQGINLQNLLRKKSSLLGYVNDSVKNESRLNIFWLFDFLEKNKIFVPASFRVLSIVQAKAVFSVRMQFNNQRAAKIFIRTVNSQSDVRIIRYSSATNSKNQIILRCELSRDGVNKDYVSLVSLPEKTDWLDSHRKQLRQLSQLSEYYISSIFEAEKMLANRRVILKLLGPVSRYFSGIKLRQFTMAESVRFKLEYTAPYSHAKRLLRSINYRIELSSFSRLVLSVSTAKLGSHKLHYGSRKMIKLVLTFRSVISPKQQESGKVLQQLVQQSRLLNIMPAKRRRVQAVRTNIDLFN